MPMDDNLILSRADLQSLYGLSLYGIEEATANPLPPKRPSPIKKKMTVVMAKPLETGEENPVYRFLTGIIQACKLSVNDISRVSPTSEEINFKYLQDLYQSPIVLMFDITPAEMGLPVFFPHFQLQNFSGVTYLSAPDLITLENDKLLKSKLWLCLKQYFSR